MSIRWRTLVAAVSVVAVSVGMIASPVLPAASAAEDTAVLQHTKSVIGGPQFVPGDTFEYEIEVGCSSTLDRLCVDTALTDSLPAPLIFDPAVPNPVVVSLSPAGPSAVTVDVDTNSFSVTPQQPGVFKGEPALGLVVGGSMLVTVSVKVPTSIGGDYNGATVTNTSIVDAGNAAEVPASADITLAVETNLVPSIDKSVSSTTVPAVPGRTVDWTVTPGNASNQSVDTIVMQDPVSPPNTFGGYLDLTGVEVAAPIGTATQTVEYWLGGVDGSWTPTAPDPLASAGGVRVTFEGSFAPDTTGEVVLHTVTNDTVAGIPDGQTVSVPNDAQTTVAQGGVQSTPVTAAATVEIAALPPDVAITKTFTDDILISGQSTTALVTATNGAEDVQQLTITEPTAGQPGFTAQGLIFDGFGAQLAWPVTSTSAEATYTYSDCVASTVSTTAVDTMPGPTAGCTVEGFAVTFAAEGDGIQARSYARLPLEVTALPVTTLEPVSSTNFVDTGVINTAGQTGVAEAEAPFTINPLRVGTVVSKSITPSQVFGVPGASANISLSGKVSDDSTVGSDTLVISDPVDPAAAPEFWDNFAPTDVNNTDIPACSALTLNYWSEDTAAWEPLPGATDIEGPVAKWSYEIPSDVQNIGGIQYVFTPTCSDTLPPGFTVITNIGIEVTATAVKEATYVNDVQSAVHNDSAVEPDATDEKQDDITVIPLEGGGPGPDFIDKAWLDVTVPALSGEVRTARLLWSTQGLELTNMTITDPSTQAELGDVSTSVYDAFDLAAIPAITPATDPLIAKDVISGVFLYSENTTEWVDITTAACVNGCTGTFGGYTLSTTEAADTLGVRIAYSERVAGAGIGSSYERRPLDLDFRIRETLRSAPTEYVLGTFHDYAYNTGEPGLVNNTVSARGVGPGVDSTSTDDDIITIIDSPINVGLTKKFDQDILGLPAPDTDPADYPLISSSLVATNQSATKVASVRIDDATAGQPEPTAFDVLNLFSIDALTPPSGVDANGATVTLTRAGVSTDYTAAQALAFTPAQLSDVTAFSVLFRGADGRPVIPSQASATVELTWQLRAEKRSGGPVGLTSPGGVPIVNEAGTFIDSPGRIPCPGDGCSTGEATADDDFNIVEANYSITTTKTIAPASVAENGSKRYTTALTGQPLGSARTTLLTLTDTTPTFWNTMDYDSIRIIAPRPVNQLAMDVLVADDVTYEVDGTGTLTALCDGVLLVADSPCWADGDWVSTVPGTAVDLALPTGVTADQVVGVRLRAQRVVDGQTVQWERPFNPLLRYTLKTDRRDTLRSDPDVLVSTTRPGLDPNPGETAPGRISDTVQADGLGQFGPRQTFEDHEQADASTLVTHLPNAIKVTKTRGSTPTVNPAGDVNYIMTVQNTGKWDMTGFEVVDRIGLVDGQSPLVEPAPISYSFTVTGPGAPSGNGGFSASLDEATGEFTIVNSDPEFVFRSGWTLRINAPLKFRPGLSPDVTVANTVTATSDRDFETCESTTTDLKPKPVESNVSECSADTAVTPRASATVSMKKWVKGDGAGDPAIPTADDLGVLNVTEDGAAELCDAEARAITDDGFYSYPCAPITRPGGLAIWRLDFLNTGNTNAKVIAAVDTLPAVGDTGVIVPGGRGSQFPVTLAGRGKVNFETLADGARGTVNTYYSTRVLSAECNTNAIQVYTSGATANPACDFGWTLFDDNTPEADLTTARSLLAVIQFANPNQTKPGPGLHPGEKLKLTFETRTPWVLPAASADPQGTPVAYNSFAGSSRTAATSTQPERGELVLEPQRVGIATATGQLQMRKIVQSPVFAVNIDLPDSYPLLVNCVSGAEQATLLFADGSDASRPSVAADGTVLVYDNVTGPVNLPLFADCSVSEDPLPLGAEVAISPGNVVAERDLSEDLSVWQPYIGDSGEAPFTIVNTYSAGGFTVSKAVDNSGAVDQDGKPIAYDQVFGFEASCTYLGQEAVAEPGRAFELVDRGSKVFTGIPTGANCTVTETAAGAAVSTSVTLTEGDGTPIVSDSSSVDFTVGAGDASITTAAFTNVMGVGSLALEKTVTGEAAEDFGDGPFTLHVVCTLENASPDTVYDNDVTLGGVEPLSTQLDNLPAGASCEVTEPDPAGATTVEIEGSPAIVGAGETATVTVINTFDSALLRVTKVIDGDGADLYGVGPFEVTLTCLDTSGEQVVIPGGAVRALDTTNAYSTTYDPLLIGLACSLVETDTGGASSTTIVNDEGNPMDEFEVVPELPGVTITNTFDLGEIVIKKTLSGGAASAHVNDVFEIAVACTWDGAELTVPGGAVQSITSREPVIIAALPYGAECAITETDAGTAAATLYTPADPDDATRAVVVVGERDQASVTIDNRFDSPLPVTGSDSTPTLIAGGIALLVLAGGVVLLLIVRRRRSHLEQWSGADGGDG